MIATRPTASSWSARSSSTSAPFGRWPRPWATIPWRGWSGRPDAFGSVCFLVASGLAYAAVGPRRLSWRPSDRGWWVAALNLIGSILFGLSAIGAYVVPATGELLSTAVANGGTFLGALGFLVGAALLFPPSVPADG